MSRRLLCCCVSVVAYSGAFEAGASIRIALSARLSDGKSSDPAGMPFMRRMYASTNVYSSELSVPGASFGIFYSM